MKTNKVEQLQRQIEVLEKRVDAIQKKCKHPKASCKVWKAQEGPLSGRNWQQVDCKICKKEWIEFLCTDHHIPITELFTRDFCMGCETEQDNYNERGL